MNANSTFLFLKDFPVLWALIFVTDPNNKIKLSRMRNLIMVIAFLPIFSERVCSKSGSNEAGHRDLTIYLNQPPSNKLYGSE